MSFPGKGNNEIADAGHLFVCLACGKTAADLYGMEGPHSPGWDEACMVNAREFPITRLEYSGSGGTVRRIKGEGES